MLSVKHLYDQIMFCEPETPFLCEDTMFLGQNAQNLN